LSGTTLEVEMNGIFGESVPVVFGDFVTEDGTDSAVDVADREDGFSGFAITNRVFAQV
jgi:hypothetical protein